MPLRIEDYALIGDCHTGALVGRDGSIDWLCLPAFDSAACFAALLGTRDNGRWLLAPRGEVRSVRRHYRAGTLVLETDWETADGAVTLIDWMPPRTREPALVRQVVGRKGAVPMQLELLFRFDYGSLVPWVRRHGQRLSAVAGPDAVVLDTDVNIRGEDLHSTATFTVKEGEQVSFVLQWYPSFHKAPAPLDPAVAVEETERWWRDWSKQARLDSPWREQVLRSLITLKALTFAPTGGIVAALTTSLPEAIGSVRNWDYRFCWLRDATFTLYSLLKAGFKEEARAWRDWLLRAVAGAPDQLNILYGIRGERRLTESELPWLPGYENSRPVRVGNAAYKQLQLDVFGELTDALHLARRSGLEVNETDWHLQRAILEHLEQIWEQPDEGIWEVRGPRRDFVHSKVMAWVAFDRAVKDAERFGLEAPLDRWKAARDKVHAQVCDKGFDARRHTFVQSYGSSDLDASLLMIPLVGFLPASDARVVGTVKAIEQDLMKDGFVMRYPTHESVDGLPPGEGAFLPCTFWLADTWSLMGRHEEAQQLFERLLGLCNDVGLISEEYDGKAHRLLGNFPQAFTHVGLVNTALNLSQVNGPAGDRHDAGVNKQ